MILKGSQRKDARAIARHLSDTSDNDHVEVHQIRGLSSGDMMQAFVEVEAISKATRCQKPFYSLSLNPPVLIGTEEFEIAVDFVEEQLGLSGQPRAIVFHEKEGRRHAHVVWSRITPDLKVINISFDHYRLRQASRDLFLQHGWTMPEGLENTEKASPRNFTHEEWMQSKRTGIHPAERKAEINRIYQTYQKEGGEALADGFAAEGYALCAGNRAVLVVDMLSGEHYALNRCVKVKVKEIRETFKDYPELKSLTEVQNHLKVIQKQCGVIDVFDLLDRFRYQELSPLLWKRKTLLAKQKRLRAEFQKGWHKKHLANQKQHGALLKDSLSSLFAAVSQDHLMAYRSLLRRGFKKKTAAEQDLYKRDFDKLRKDQFEERNSLVGLITNVKKKHAQQKSQQRKQFAALLSSDILNLIDSKDALLRYFGVQMPPENGQSRPVKFAKTPKSKN